MPIKFFFDQDVSMEPLSGKTIVVIGFGSQGQAQAKNLKDSGINAIIGLRKNSKSANAAKDYGFEVFSVSEAVKRSDIIHFLIPDEEQPNVYEKQIAPFLDESKSLCFSHGFNIVFKKIFPPKNIDVFMVSPHAPGPYVRKLFLEGKGAAAMACVHQNATGNARQTALAVAKGCGFTRAGVYEATFEQETFSDLFAEQAVLCGGLSELVKKGFETMVEAGYPKELAFLSCAYEIRLIADLVSAKGIEGMWGKVSNTAEFGGRTRGPKIIDETVKKRMKQLLSEVESGKFAKEWGKEFESKSKIFNKLRKTQSEHEIEQAFESVKNILWHKKIC